jgi:HK97 family phage portal protein
MTMFDRIRSAMKALRDPSSVISADIGPQAVMRGFSVDRGMRREPLPSLARRYFRWVHRCVTINAQSAAAVQRRLYVIGSKSIIEKCDALRPRPLDRRTKAYLSGRLPDRPPPATMKRISGEIENMTEVTSHPFLDLLNQVNEWDDGFSFAESQYADLEIFGRLFTAIIGPANGPIEQLWRLRPQWMQVIPHPAEFVSHYEYRPENTFHPTRYERDEVFWLKLNDPSDPWGGMGPLEAWLQSIDADHAMVAFQDWLFRHGGKPEIIVSAKQGMNQTEVNAFRAMWRRFFGNMTKQDRESVAVISGDVTVTPLTHTGREMEYSRSRELIRDEVCQAFGVPKSLVTSDDVNLANAREGSITYMRHKILPLVCRLNEAYNAKLLPRYGQQLVLIHDSPINEDRAIVIQDRASKLQSGWSINEIRVDEGREPLSDPNADVPLVDASLMTLERAVNPPDPVSFYRPSVAEAEAEVEAEDEAEAEAEESKAVRPESQRKAWLSGCGHEKAFGVNPDDPFAEAVGRVMREQARAVADAISSGSPPVETAARILADPRWNAMLVEASRAYVEQAFALGGDAGMDRLIQAGGQPAGGPFDTVNPAVRRFVDSHVARLASETNAYTRVQLRDLLGDGMDRGETIDQLKRRVQAWASEVGDSSRGVGWRAARIARTESARAFMAGQEEAWKQSGVVAGKRWLLAPDACEFCEAAAAEFNSSRTVPLGRAFYPLGATLTGTQGGVMRFDYEEVGGPPLHPQCRCDLIPVFHDET